MKEHKELNPDGWESLNYWTAKLKHAQDAVVYAQGVIDYIKDKYNLEPD